jgi:hypothetical protein
MERLMWIAMATFMSVEKETRFTVSARAMLKLEAKHQLLTEAHRSTWVAI